MEQNSVYARRFTGEGLTFDDVLLVPAESDVLPADIDLHTNLTKKIQDKSHYYQVEIVTVFSTLELSIAVGKSRKVLAVTDAGFTKKMRSLME